MQKQTLVFTSIGELSSFVKPLHFGYLINTNNLTITARFDDPSIEQAIANFNAKLIETSDQVFCYD